MESGIIRYIAIHDPRDLEAPARQLQGMAARAAAQIEYGGARRGLDEVQELLDFAHGVHTRVKLRKEKALQPLPEGIIFKSGPHAHSAVLPHFSNQVVSSNRRAWL
jgi:hypothetical protein